MAYYAPPYIGKLTAKLEIEVLRANKKVLKAQKGLEYAKAYKELCERKLDEAKAKEKETK